MNQDKINHCVENLCLKGCEEVLIIIQKLERRQIAEDIQGLNDDEISAVLSELKAIMAVYLR